MISNINTIMSVEQVIDPSQDIESIRVTISEAMNNVDNIYSYLLYAKYDDDGHITQYVAQYNISQTDKFNTLKSDIVAKHIADVIENRDTDEIKYVVDYLQPPVDIMLQTYDPLICKLSKQQHERWNSLEYEDLCQTCRLVILKLYRKNYYIHRRLVEKAFNNEVLMELKKDVYKPNIISLDTKYSVSDNDEDLCLADTIPDTQQQYEQQDEEVHEARMQIFERLKDIIINMIGKRQYEQLLLAYGNKHTDNWSRKKMNTLRTQLSKLKIDVELFNEYF